MNHDDVLNEAIDQVARELTDGVPRHGLAGRVQQRLEAPRPVVRWQLAAGAIAALAAIVWFALPGPTIGPALPPRIEAMDRVLPPPPLAAREARPVPIAREPRNMRHRVRPRPSLDMRIPVDIESAPQLTAIRDANDLTVSQIEIPELTLAPLEPEKEPR